MAITPLDLAAAALVVVGLSAYLIFGGADFGGGVWDLFATGERARAQRMAIAAAMGPVWEVNHIWIIFVLVMLWTAFPKAYLWMFDTMNVPIGIALIGIVLRGASFIFRNYGTEVSEAAERYQVIFGIASLITPFFLGATFGGIAEGTGAWMSPFAVAVGLFVVAMCALLAAAFLMNETIGELREDFRRRGLIAWFAVAGFGAVALACDAWQGGKMAHEIVGGRALTVYAAGLCAGLVTLAALWTHRRRVARIASVVQIAAVAWGWALAQYPYAVIGQFTIAEAAAPAPTLVASLTIVVIGLLFLLPSLWFLFRTFKTQPVRSP